MRIEILNEFIHNGKFHATFKYWQDGKCACTATKVTKSFDTKPTRETLLKSI